MRPICRFIKILFFSLLFVCFSESDAQINYNDGLGKIKIESKGSIDSLYIDGQKVDLPNTRMISVSADSHFVIAYLGNYTPFSKTVYVRAYHICTVPVAFSRPVKNSLLLSLIKWSKSVGINPHIHSKKISLGISLRSFGFYSAEISEEFIKKVQTGNAIIQVHKKLKKRVNVSPEGSFVSNVSFNFAYQAPIYKGINIRLFGSFYPKIVTQVQLYDTIPYTSGYGEPTYVGNHESAFYLAGLDITIPFLSSANPNFCFLVGGFLSNSIADELELEVSNPYIYTFTEPLVTEFNYSYSANGVSTGAMMTVSLSKNTSLSAIYKVYFYQTFQVGLESEKNIMSDLSANFIYHF